MADILGTGGRVAHARRNWRAGSKHFDYKPSLAPCGRSFALVFRQDRTASAPAPQPHPHRNRTRTATALAPQPHRRAAEGGHAGLPSPETRHGGRVWPLGYCSAGRQRSLGPNAHHSGRGR
ncbi:hypothetical protein GCM10009020_31510 [Natronoarchaeum mannanilyticum]|uniref:Uncharacterized protein n=1 Tax=Natronoarchaeum mannanilyticum TaxID=926360 RepID=A0AAV3TDZ2_9EURY